jgi:hypothetical protein
MGISQYHPAIIVKAHHRRKRHVTSKHVPSCHLHVTLCHDTTCHIMSQHDMSRHYVVTSWQAKQRLLRTSYRPAKNQLPSFLRSSVIKRYSAPWQTDIITRSVRIWFKAWLWGYQNRMVSLESVMSVFYRLSTVTIVLSLPISAHLFVEVSLS